MSNISFRELTAYKKSFSLAMEIFQLTASFPKEEKYGLSSQIKRSSRSVCATIAERYRKRIYRAYFVSKSTDADMENSETQAWLDFALHCKFIEQDKYKNLHD